MHGCQWRKWVNTGLNALNFFGNGIYILDCIKSNCEICNCMQAKRFLDRFIWCSKLNWFNFFEKKKMFSELRMRRRERWRSLKVKAKTNEKRKIFYCHWKKKLKKSKWTKYKLHCKLLYCFVKIIIDFLCVIVRTNLNYDHCSDL